jgi:hypothetical protein
VASNHYTGRGREVGNMLVRLSREAEALEKLRDQNRDNPAGRHMSLAITHIEDAVHRLGAAAEHLDGLSTWTDTITSER